jgi:hypothetical protein
MDLAAQELFKTALKQDDISPEDIWNLRCIRVKSGGTDGSADTGHMDLSIQNERGKSPRNCIPQC